MPQWLREELIDCNRSPVSERSLNSAKSDMQIHKIEDRTDWSYREAGDGNSNQHDSDFGERFSVKKILRLAQGWEQLTSVDRTVNRLNAHFIKCSSNQKSLRLLENHFLL